MTGFRISAAPLLFTDGEQQGQLKGIIFTARSSAGTRQWFTGNHGQFEAAFSQMMSPQVARERISALMQGREVQFL
jgi:hypothetical protein